MGAENEGQKSMDVTFKVLAEVAAERVSQDRAFGQQDHDFGTWSKILIEQVGDASKAAINVAESKNPGSEAAIRKELVQAAAVAVAMIESFDRGKCR